MMFIRKFIATGAGVGYFPLAPGTMGSLAGWLIALGIKQSSYNADSLLVVLILIFTFLGVWASGGLEHLWGKDPKQIVIDEIVGVWIALFHLHQGWLSVTMAFILFRLFDIYKPLFISQAEKLKGGWGIMADDALAGIYANLMIQLTYLIQPYIMWHN